MESYDGENIYNINLVCVISTLNRLMGKIDFCHCEVCLNDICALTLTKLPPCYATNLYERENLISNIDQEHIKQLMIKLIDQVTKLPHH